jgi:signal transduction histidine kinase
VIVPAARTDAPRPVLLVVDAEPANRDVLSRRLAPQGFAVRVAADGAEALALLAAETIDLVLLDVMMPGQSGLDVLRAMRADPRTHSLPVIMVTARSDSQDVVEALDLGASDYVTKPIDFPVVLARVRAQLGRVTAERAALALQRQFDLQHAQKLSAVGLLSGGVAHDFNNLLTAIQGNGELLLDEFAPDDDRRHYVTHILKAATSAAALTRQLLAFSRRQGTGREPLDLARATDGMGRLLRRVIGDRITLTVTAPDDLWRIVGDAGELDQVVLNLVVNACDAMPDGGRLAITLANRPGADGRPDQVELAVSDTGGGIDEATRPHIFEPFFTTKAPGHGTGLGLAMVQTIVTGLGGTVDVVSAPGQGTTFFIRLPRAVAATAGGASVATPMASPALSARVLLVEDDTAVRRVVRHWLERAGCSVTDAPDPVAAETLARTADPLDLLVTDISMPGGDGPDLWQALRASRPDLGVVFMSAYDTARHIGRLEGRPVLQKPFRADTLLRAVRQALDARAPAEAPPVHRS